VLRIPRDFHPFYAHDIPQSLLSIYSALDHNELFKAPFLIPVTALRFSFQAPRSTRGGRIALIHGPDCIGARKKKADMADIERISVKQAREKAYQALLVCAYENEAKHRMFNLDGSISLANFRSRLASLPKTQEIIFY
jgi:hypothetical protein